MEKKQKKFQQIELPLSFLIPKDEKPDKYSNTLEFFDAIPKYIYSKQDRNQGKYLDIIKWDFQFKNHEYGVTLKPTRIVEKEYLGKGAVIEKERDYFPGKVEEVVHDSLIKMACSGKGRYYDQEAGLIFTLGQIQKELTENGYKYSKARIARAIEILRDTAMHVLYDGQKYSTGILKEAIIPTREQWIEGKERFCFVQFHRLITKSIINGTNRLLDYNLLMELNSGLTRWLQKQMSHNFTQANYTNNYNILLSTVIRDSKTLNSKKLSDNAREMKSALEELKQKQWISSYQIELKKDGRKIIDYKYIIKPGHRCVRTVITGNKILLNYRKTTPDNKQMVNFVKKSLKGNGLTSI